MANPTPASRDRWRVTEPADQAWVEPRLTPQPILTFIEPTRLTGAVDSVPTSAIVVEPSAFPFRQLAAGAGLDASGVGHRPRRDGHRTAGTRHPADEPDQRKDDDMNDSEPNARR